MNNLDCYKSQIKIMLKKGLEKDVIAMILHVNVKDLEEYITNNESLKIANIKQKRIKKEKEKDYYIAPFTITSFEEYEILIKSLAKLGKTDEEIAGILGIDEKSFQNLVLQHKITEQLLKEGREVCNAKLAQTLFESIQPRKIVENIYYWEDVYNEKGEPKKDKHGNILKVKTLRKTVEKDYVGNHDAMFKWLQIKYPETWGALGVNGLDDKNIYGVLKVVQESNSSEEWEKNAIKKQNKIIEGEIKEELKIENT